MAEAVLAFGIAANVIQFIDFSTKVLSMGYRLGKAGHEGLQENQTTETIISDLHKVTQGLKSSLRQQEEKQRLTQSESDLQDLTEQCRDVALELLEILKKLKVQGNSRKWETFRVALKTVWEEDKIERLQKRVDGFRQQVIIRLLVSFR